MAPSYTPISNESTRYAQTRYPFPPFCIRFNSDKVTPNHIKESLIDHCKNAHQLDLKILNCRLSYGSYGSQYDILLFLKDALSFSFLMDHKHWPDAFNNVPFIIPTWPPIPPQLSLLVKNVDLRIDFNEFCMDVKTRYPQVKNVVRLKNKFQNEIKLVKLEFTSSVIRDKILDDKKIIIGYIAYEIGEYLAPAYVLICSKCMGIGHFKKQCTQSKSTCRTCGNLVDDLKLHKCSNVDKCIHCGQNHKSNSLKCQMVKSFRAELTRKILSSGNPLSSCMPIGCNNMNMNSSNMVVNGSNHPIVPPLSLPHNVMLSKLDDLLVKISEMNVHLSNIKFKCDRFEQFMIENNESDSSMKENLNLLSSQTTDLKNETVANSRLVQQHDNLLMKVIIPMFEHLSGLIISLNQDKRGNHVNADVKLKLERYITQMKKAKEGKQFTN
jgi:hypothetical protein